MKRSLEIVLWVTFLYHSIFVSSKSITANGRNKIPVESLNAGRGPPVLLNEGSQKLFASVRDNVELNCPIKSNSPPIFEWFKGRERITDLWERFEPSSQGKLKIRSVINADSGVYVCKAINGFGSSSYELQLAVTGEDPFKDNLLKSSTNKRNNHTGDVVEPEIIRDNLPRSELKIITGQNLQLKCEASGNPLPTITWIKDNDTLVSSRDNANVAILKFTNVTTTSSGTYVCEASNAYGKDSFSVFIEITGALHGAAEIIDLTPKSMKLSAGKDASITCIARFENDDYKMLFWLKEVEAKTKETIYLDGYNYKVLKNTKMQEHGNHVYSAEYSLTNVSLADAGNYSCAVAGLMGYNHSQVRVFIEPHHMVLPTKQDAARIQWATLWAITFLILTLLIVFCISRHSQYGCRSPLKSRNPIPQTKMAIKQQVQRSSILSSESQFFQPLMTPLNSSCLAQSTECRSTMRNFSINSNSGVAESEISCSTHNSIPERVNYLKTRRLVPNFPSECSSVGSEALREERRRERRKRRGISSPYNKKVPCPCPFPSSASESESVFEEQQLYFPKLN